MESDLFQQIEHLQKKLDISVSSLRKTGQDMAEKERIYRMTYTAEVLKLRDQGMPVTLISNVAPGLKPVADAKYDYIVAEAMYSANQDAINSYKLQLRLLDAQLGREWSQAGRG